MDYYLNRKSTYKYSIDYIDCILINKYIDYYINRYNTANIDTLRF